MYYYFLLWITHTVHSTFTITISPTSPAHQSSSNDFNFLIHSTATLFIHFLFGHKSLIKLIFWKKKNNQRQGHIQTVFIFSWQWLFTSPDFTLDPHITTLDYRQKLGRKTCSSTRFPTQQYGQQVAYLVLLRYTVKNGYTLTDKKDPLTINHFNSLSMKFF